MKKLLLLFLIFLAQLGFAQEPVIQIKTYSYTEFFQLIEDEKDSVFILKNARIEFDSLTDMAHAYARNTKDTANLNFWRTDTLYVSKALELDNVFFTNKTYGPQNYSHALHHIEFGKSVTLRNSIFDFTHCQFRDRVRIFYTDEYETAIISQSFQGYLLSVSLYNSKLFKGFGLSSYSEADNEIGPMVFVSNNLIYLSPKVGNTTSVFIGTGNYLTSFTNNTLLDRGDVLIGPSKGTYLDILKNEFADADVLIILGQEFTIPKLSIAQNQFNRPVAIDINELQNSNRIDWDQFKGGFFDYKSLMESYIDPSSFGFLDSEVFNNLESDSLKNAYLTTDRIQNKEAFKAETLLLGKLNSLYKAQHDMEFANGSYIAIKDLETQRQAYLYQTNPSFNTFFKWKINQFLKLFSAYGTEPARAITFSVYVILGFALVYLFFPNHWDSHGKNRIKDRFLFFHKYLRHPKGIHDIYLEEKKGELESAMAFQKVMDDYRTEVPEFFYRAAKPLYRWSVAGTRLYASLLSKVDFLKGTWRETEPKTRGVKTAMTIVIFIIALLYDIFIKILNAIMLSINTFTTLGFGEIPIKGLPRYLAIIQGFIGWFMLTIFSVSLISQLLN